MITACERVDLEIYAFLKKKLDCLETTKRTLVLQVARGELSDEDARQQVAQARDCIQRVKWWRSHL